MGQVVKPLYTPRYVPSGDEVAVIETSKGTIRVALDGKSAPVTVGNFIELACKGFYDDLNFYNRQEGDVVVGGCPITRPLRPQEVRMAVREQLRGVHPGIGDAGYFIRDEWEENPHNHHVEGTLSLTHKVKPNSGSCQFFFCLADHPEYDDRFTAFGQVTEGLDVVHHLRVGDEIKSVSIEGAHELPNDDDLPETMMVEGEEGEEEVPNPNYQAMQALGKLLAIEGYEILTAYDGMEALGVLEKSQPDLILLDVMMPRLNGLSALMKIRESHNIPAIMLSAKTEESDKVSGLLLGADDYIEKPYNPAELLARVQAQLRRYKAYGGSHPAAQQKADEIVNGGLTLDMRQKLLFVDGEAVRLTATEYKITELLMRHIGQVFSAAQIYENVWNENADFSVENTVMVHIRHIREKIEIDPKNPRYVKVVWGIGYKMEKHQK